MYGSQILKLLFPVSMADTRWEPAGIKPPGGTTRSMEGVETVVVALWAMLPAYLPNNAAVIAGGGRPIDGGRTWGGKRVLGDGKTWRGTAVGVAVGTLLALALNAIRPGDFLGATPPEFPVSVGIALSAGAMLGDIAASFLKRRTGRERGAVFPVVDQLDFVAGALVLAAIAAPSWFGDVFTPPLLLTVVLITPLLHLGTNLIAYALGVKSEPW
jgi:CDP-2,3-bis-(O-geranylgeranyl)-sn-glycerol synthase